MNLSSLQQAMEDVEFNFDDNGQVLKPATDEDILLAIEGVVLEEAEGSGIAQSQLLQETHSQLRADGYRAVSDADILTIINNNSGDGKKFLRYFTADGPVADRQRVAPIIKTIQHASQVDFDRDLAGIINQLQRYDIKHRAPDYMDSVQHLYTIQTMIKRGLVGMDQAFHLSVAGDLVYQPSESTSGSKRLRVSQSGSVGGGKRMRVSQSDY